MKHKIKISISVAFLSLLTACASSLVVQSDSDSQYDLSAFKTYSIVTPTLDDQEEMISINPILIQRIARALDSVLSQKGLNKSENSDITVRFYIGTKREVERSTDLGGYGYYRYGYLDSRDQRLSGQKKMRYLLDFTIPKPMMSCGMLLLDLKEQVISMIKLV